MVTKIRCMTLDGGYLSSNTYKAPSGIRYMFNKGMGTEMKTREDAEFFLNAGKGGLFKKVTLTGKLIDTLKAALSDVAKEMPQMMKKKEEPAEEEKSDVKGEVPKEEVKPEVKKEEDTKLVEPEVKKLTKTELKDLSKKAQIDMIRGFGESNIPGLEGERVELLLKLQGGD